MLKLFIKGNKKLITKKYFNKKNSKKTKYN